ncbi:MAG: penicillin acylase family protein, partial [Myxococcota bacterium]
MSKILKIVGALVAVLLVGVVVVAVSLPPSVFLPPDLPTKGPLELRATSTSGPAAAVDIVYDERGIPHVFGESDQDLAYGLGFVQARDRLYQLDVLRHAATGRLTELFGEDLIDSDKVLRMLTYDLEGQLEAMAPRDTEMLDRFTQGVNDGAAHAGRSLEMRILGTVFEPFKPSEVLAIVRLQSWGLAFDSYHELFRDRLREKLSADDPRFAAIMGTIPSGGVPIVQEQAHSGAKVASIEALRMRLNGQGDTLDGDPTPAPEESSEGVEHGALFEPLRRAFAQRVRPMLEDITAGSVGASNSWVVSGEHTKSGAPLLSNDPHLRHSLPSVFYMVHLEHPDFRVAGVTFPGIPAVLIGHTSDLAWGFTTSYVDAQDLVRLDVTEDGEGYRIDGKVERFTEQEQVFRMGQGAGAEEVKETSPRRRESPGARDAPCKRRSEV